MYRLNLNLTEKEAEALKAYARLTKRTQSDIVREFIRNLKTYSFLLDSLGDE